MTRKLSLDKHKIRIVLLEGVHQRAVDVLKTAGYENVEHLKTALSGDDLTAALQKAHMVGIRSRTQLTPAVFDKADKLMAVGCFCIGTNQVHLDDAALRGIPVFNAPHSNTRSVAELVIGQTIMLMRGIFPKSMAAHHGGWSKSAKGSHEVRGKVMGIVGYGHIGSQVSVLAEAMGMQVLFYDIQSKLPLGNARACDSLEELLGASDVVTLHVPEDATTKNMMDGDRIAKMRPGAFLINASRGSVVDIGAMAQALRNEHLAGGAVDVYPTEPRSNQETFDSPLRGLHQVILTPHIGGSTVEAQANIGQEVAAKLVAYSDMGTSEGAVNFPAVNMPDNPAAHRILHIHRNTPGILREINKAIADNDINVLGQQLATNANLGYVVLDVAKSLPEDAMSSLNKIAGTIRTRILY